LKLGKINEPNCPNIKQDIVDLTINPRPHGYKKLKGRDGYRIRVSDYCIIYNIFDHLLVIDIITLGHRKDIYE
jgi:mRNA interferase RelE/StbE